MTPDDALAELRELETRLRSAPVQAAYRDRPETERRRLAAERTELSLLLERLTTARIESLATPLHVLDGELKAATAEAKRRLETVDRPAAALNALARLLGVLARLVVLAG